MELVDGAVEDRYDKDDEGRAPEGGNETVAGKQKRNRYSKRRVGNAVRDLVNAENAFRERDARTRGQEPDRERYRRRGEITEKPKGIDLHSNIPFGHIARINLRLTDDGNYDRKTESTNFLNESTALSTYKDNGFIDAQYLTAKFGPFV